MIKTYRLTTPVRNSSIVLRGKTGNSLRYNFAGGDPVIGKDATIMLQSQYAQQLLEDSDIFRKGYVKLVRADQGGEKVNAQSREQKNSIEEVTSPEQLIEFVATNLDKVYQRPEAALAYAKTRGYDFPNLKTPAAQQ